MRRLLLNEMAVFGRNKVVELFVRHRDVCDGQEDAAVVLTFGCRKTFLSVTIATFLDARRDGVVLGNVATFETTFLPFGRHKPVDDDLRSRKDGIT